LGAQAVDGGRAAVAARTGSRRSEQGVRQAGGGLLFYRRPKQEPGGGINFFKITSVIFRKVNGGVVYLKIEVVLRFIVHHIHIEAWWRPKANMVSPLIFLQIIIYLLICIYM
jgi:hypothetical protein